MKSKQTTEYNISNEHCGLIGDKKINRSIRKFITIGMVIIPFLMIYLSACKKIIAIPPPAQSITTQEVFADSTDADAAILGIYASLEQNGGGGLTFGNGLFTLDCGLSADELVNGSNGGYSYTPIYLNNLNSQNAGSLVDALWSEGYAIIYQANASIEGLQKSTGISGATKAQLIAEAKFLRAFCYFNLINAYGDVPFETTSDYKTNALMPRTAKALIYQQLIVDLLACQTNLRKDYSISGGERTRANQAAATALLARIYLYTGDNKDAVTQSSSLINESGTYSLNTDLNAVFLKNSSEAILQWAVNPSISPYNATIEGYNFISSDGNEPNYVYLAPQLLSAFESGDKRRISWVDSATYNGSTYYFPYKYKVGPFQSVPNETPTEYYMVFRLGEQYLIRAESEANSNELSAAINDLNMIRSRAGLPAYSGSTTDKTAVLGAIYHEDQIELCFEWGHRWFDLKRTGQVDAVMSIVTPLKNGGTTWKSLQQLYPIAQIELQNNPNLKQTPGY